MQIITFVLEPTYRDMNGYIYTYSTAREKVLQSRMEKSAEIFNFGQETISPCSSYERHYGREKALGKSQAVSKRCFNTVLVFLLYPSFILLGCLRALSAVTKVFLSFKLLFSIYFRDFLSFQIFKNLFSFIDFFLLLFNFLLWNLVVQTEFLIILMLVTKSSAYLILLYS